MSGILAKYLIDIENQLHNISKVLNLSGFTQYDSWDDIQRIVRSGLAFEYFPIGTELITKISDPANPDATTYSTERTYTVVAHDYYKSATDSTAHTMTLLSKNVIDWHMCKLSSSMIALAVPYSSPEALAYCSNGLSAGNYYIDILGTTISGARLYITVASDLASGGLLYPENPYLSSWSYLSPDGTKTSLSSYEKLASYTNLSAWVSVSNRNNYHRAIHGNNNYKESDIRQFLNSNKGAGEWWVPQDRFSKKNAEYDYISGFQTHLEADFLKVVGEVIVPCVTNAEYENVDSGTTAGEQYTIIDKFFLPSQYEITGQDDQTLNDGTEQFPYYKNSIAADRIKYTTGSTKKSWRTRTPYSGTPTTSNSYIITESGLRSAEVVDADSVRVAVVCNIV